MGVCVAKPKVKSEFEPDEQQLAAFLAKQDNLDAVWTQMDKDGNNVLDRREFQHLLYVSLSYFCQQVDPRKSRPTREEMEPYVQVLTYKLGPRMDKNRDGKISRREFNAFGEYLFDEQRKLTAQNDGHDTHAKAHASSNSWPPSGSKKMHVQQQFLRTADRVP